MAPVATEENISVQSEEQIKATFERRLRASYEYYSKRIIRIKNKLSQLVPLERNTVQKIVEEIEQDIRKSGRLVRIIMLKGRQFGISTDRLAKNYWRTSTNSHKTAMFVTQEPKATAHLFGIVKRMHENIPLIEWKPDIKYSNASELVFAGIDSAIRVGTAGTDNVGTSQTINYLHLSELAKYPKHTAKSILTSILQCVPKSDPESEVFIESTAFGIGNEFYERFIGARYVYTVYLYKGKPAWKMVINEKADKDNAYSSIFIPWFCHGEYVRDPEPGFTRTEKEQALVALHGINDAHLAWRRDTIANECGGSEEEFEQEYATTPESAFLGSGRPVFPTQKIALQKKAIEELQATKDNRKFYSCLLSNGQWMSTTPEMGKTDSLLVVYEEPKPGMAYVVSGDVAEGLEKGDFDSLHVVEQLSGKDAATWHGHIDPDLFGTLMYHVGKRYNIAWVAPERNNHGNTTVTKLVNMDYPNIYVETVIEPPNKPRKRYGWFTGRSKTAKGGLIDALVAEYRDHPQNFRDAETLGEMLTFAHQDDGGMEAVQGKFDDRVISRAIANYVRGRLPLPSSNSVTQAGILGPSSVSSKKPPASAYT
jgi:hypothetical protein